MVKIKLLLSLAGSYRRFLLWIGIALCGLLAIFPIFLFGPTLLCGNLGTILSLHVLLDQKDNDARNELAARSERFMRCAISTTQIYPSAWTNLGLALFFQDRMEDAVDAWQNDAEHSTDLLIRLGDKSMDTLVHFGYRSSDNYQEAVLWYESAAKVSPSWTLPWIRIGRLYARKGEWAIAQDKFRHATELAPASTRAWYELGDAYENAGEWTLAVEAYQRGMESILLEGKSNLYFRRAWLRQHRLIPRDFDGAREDYTKAIDLDSFDFVQWHQLASYRARGELWAREGDWRAALIEYEQSLSLDPRNYDTRLLYAIALFNLGQEDRALMIVNEVIVSRPNSPDAYVVLGNLYAAQNESKKAEEMYRKALQIAPGNRMAVEGLEAIETK